MAYIIVDSTEKAGSDNAAQLELGHEHRYVDFYFNVGKAGTLVVEVSRDGNNWRLFDKFESASGGEEDTAQYSTEYRFTRVYADGADFADADVILLELSSK